MINHGRTLLMNSSGTELVPDWVLGEQLIDPTFVALALPQYLLDIRHRLFGAAPDRQFMNYRLAQYMNVLHATELLDYLTALDPRMTDMNAAYPELFLNTAFAPLSQSFSTSAQQGHSGIEPQQTPQPVAWPLFGPLPYTPEVQSLENTSMDATIIGEASSPDASGQSWYNFLVSLIGSSLTLTSIAPQSKNQLLTVSFTDGLSETVPLGDSGYSLLVPQIAAGAWQVSFRLRPTWDLGQILAACRTAGDPVLSSLFGLKRVEPYRTFHNLFQKHPELAYALGGLLLAAIYRSEEVRLG